MLIADARVVVHKYRELYGADSVFIPYGANIVRDESTAALDKWGLEPRKYVLFVGRLVPENAADCLVDAFSGVETDMKLVIVGDAPYSDEYKRRLRDAADERVVFTGYAFGSDYAQLSSHAYLFVQPSAVDGTRPATLDQLGYGNCVLVRNTAVNMETINDCGCSFDKDRLPASLADKLQELIASPETVEECRSRAISRITHYYNWDWVADAYEHLFSSLVAGQALVSYDDYLADSGKLPRG